MYDELTAIHYAAYRPKLHELLLAKCLDDDISFKVGLDIGCGTGRSSVALTKYCDKVIAIDPSIEMLLKAEPNAKVTYIQMKEALHIPDETYNIITFAGSLFYCKSQNLYDHIIKKSRRGTVVVVYDFNIRLEIILEKLELNFPKEINAYDHAVDFSDLNTERLIELTNGTDTIFYPIGISDLSHFLLSHHSIYQIMSLDTTSADIYDQLSKKLANLSKDITGTLQADLYYKKYHII